jgi:hypothetical protein
MSILVPTAKVYRLPNVRTIQIVKLVEREFTLVRMLLADNPVVSSGRAAGLGRWHSGAARVYPKNGFSAAPAVFLG